jgi:hypothetical protein
MLMPTRKLLLLERLPPDYFTCLSQQALIVMSQSLIHRLTCRVWIQGINSGSRQLNAEPCKPSTSVVCMTKHQCALHTWMQVQDFRHVLVNCMQLGVVLFQASTCWQWSKLLRNGQLPGLRAGFALVASHLLCVLRSCCASSAASALRLFPVVRCAFSMAITQWKN